MLEEARDKLAQVAPHKVLAHGEAKCDSIGHLRSQVPWEQYALNALADAVADAAAEVVSPLGTAKILQAWDQRVYHVAVRLAILEAEAFLALPTSVPSP